MSKTLKPDGKMPIKLTQKTGHIPGPEDLYPGSSLK